MKKWKAIKRNSLFREGFVCWQEIFAGFYIEKSVAFSKRRIPGKADRQKEDSARQWCHRYGYILRQGRASLIQKSWYRVLQSKYPTIHNKQQGICFKVPNVFTETNKMQGGMLNCCAIIFFEKLQFGLS